MHQLHPNVAREPISSAYRAIARIAGRGTFAAVDAHSDELEIAGTKLLVLTIEGLEKAKRAAGRPKDLVDLGYLKALKS